MNSNPGMSIEAAFADMQDPRVSERCTYPLDEIVLIASAGRCVGQRHGRKSKNLEKANRDGYARFWRWSKASPHMTRSDGCIACYQQTTSGLCAVTQRQSRTTPCRCGGLVRLGVAARLAGYAAFLRRNGQQKSRTQRETTGLGIV